MNKYELALVVNAKIEEDVRLATVEKAKDYIASPKPNGYRSYHMIIHRG